jgi:hypothetical protein
LEGTQSPFNITVSEGLEFVAGLLVFVVGLSCIALSLRLGKYFANLCLLLGFGCELAIFATIGADWGYSSIDISPLKIAIDRNPWILTPHLFALLCLFLPIVYPSFSIPYLVAICAGQAVSFVLVFEFVGMDTDTSFLSAYPILSIYLSLVSSFLFLARALYHIPKEDTHWHKIAFGNRIALIKAIQSLKEIGFSTAPPETIVDSGSAKGNIGATTVSITTKMRLFPPAHGLKIEWRFEKPPASLPPLPSSFEDASFGLYGTCARMEKFFTELNDITFEQLRDFLHAVAV